MKKFLILLLALASVSAVAFHPGDEERLVRIGVGTKLKVLRDINIVPTKNFAHLGGDCYLVVKETKNYDRVLAAGSILTVLKVKLIRDVTDLFVDNKNIAAISCIPDKGVSTIGDLKNGTKDTLEVILADPTRI